jgi:hypothetical protein
MANSVKVEIDEKTLVSMVVSHLQNKLGSVEISKKDVVIETKSKQNYSSEWERAAFRASVVVNLDLLK